MPVTHKISITKPEGTRMRSRDFIRMYVRTFFIQATFTFKEMLGTGFGFILLPGLSRIAKDDEHLKQLLNQHNRYFNTHPYLASYIAGSILRLEEQNMKNSTTDTVEIENIKTRLAGVLGSLGDRLFWKYLKPMASVTALLAIFLFRSWHPGNVITGVLIFLFVFNAFHLFYRLRGIRIGYTHGASVIRCKSLAIIEKLNYIVSCITLGFLGILVVVESKTIYDGNEIGTIIFLVAGIAAFYANYKKSAPVLGILTGQLTAFAFYLFIR